MHGLVPAVKFPTTLIIIDDNPEFLNNVELNIGGEYQYKSFTSAKAALAFIKEQEKALSSLIKKFLSVSVEDAEMSTAIAHLNVSRIHDILYNPQRFALSSVIITDFAMPDMNGLELCEQLENRHMKIIMLTGEAGFELAVSGFNRGLIDQFVLKGKPGFFEEAKQYAIHLESKLFEEISKNLLDAISGSAGRGIFNDPVFIKFFKELLNEYNIVEYYLMDPSGSYLLVNGNGQVYWLLLKNEADMKVLDEIASEEANDQLFIDAIKTRKKLAFFFDAESQLLSLESWHLEDANILKGRNTYYYSIIKGTDAYYRLKNDKILPYFDCLKS